MAHIPVLVRVWGRFQQAASLRGQHEFLTVMLTQRIAYATLAQALPVMRRRIEKAHARLPGRGGQRRRLVIGHGGVKIA